LTLDKSWFDLSTDREMACLQQEQSRPQKAKPMIQGKKRQSQYCGIQSAFTLSTSFHTDTHLLLPIEHILERVLQFRLRGGKRWLFIQAENGDPCRSEAPNMV
jgi:hypothetical protein